MFTFERLAVWQKSVDFADVVYAVTRSFPADERFGLTNQMRRAAVSVVSNIAEGSSRSSRVDFARFIEIATGSVFEIVAQASIAKRQNVLSNDEYDTLYKAASELNRMLASLRKSLQERK